MSPTTIRRGVSRFVRRAAERLRGLAGRRRQRVQVAYAILVGDEVQGLFGELQKNVVDALGATPPLHAVPHITLKLGFDVTAMEPFERYVDELARDVAPFEIRVGGVDFFDEGVVFLDVERSPELDALRHRIVSDLSKRHGVQPYPLEGDVFRYHVTIAYGLSTADLDRARRSLSRATEPHRFALQTLGLLTHDGDRWTTHKQATLAAGNAGGVR